MSPFFNFEQTIDWLYNLHLFGIKFGLKKIEKLLEFLGNPQEKLKIIHVGGTNGKGSVCTMISSMLVSAGYKVGLNTSPHLSEFTERIQINGEQISKNEVIEYANLMEKLRERVNSETEFGYATYFEVVTAMALKYFVDNDVDYVVLEVGLGGTYDATNVVKPMVTVLTNIDLDHTEHLGHSLTSVAENKAGIIKQGSPVVTSNTHLEVLKVISKTCEKLGNTLYQLGNGIKFDLVESNTSGVIINYHGIDCSYSNLQIPLIGTHQGENAALALAALELLSTQDIKIGMLSEDDLRDGLTKSVWPGRLEILQKAPFVLVDGAHNPSGAKTLKNALKLFDYKNLHLVFGCSEEKDIKSILHELLPLAYKIYITKAAIRRAAEPDLIIRQINDCQLEKIVMIPVQAAVKTALDQAEENDLVCICGSLFVVGEARELWRGSQGKSDSEKLPRFQY